MENVMQRVRPRTGFHQAAPFAVLRVRFDRMWRRLGFIVERQRQRRALAQLDARMLADIGVSADAARREANKPFWLD